MLGTPVQLNLDKYSITSTESIPWLRAPDRKPSQRLTFIKQSLSQEDSQQTIADNRNRIKNNFKFKLSTIISKPQDIEVNISIDGTNLQDEITKKSKFISKKINNLSQKLDLELSYFQTEKIFLDVSQYFGDYEVLNVLGEGCIGLVKRVMHRKSGLYYAVKMVATTDEEVIRNMVIEFHNLVKLSHDNIVKMHELYIDYNDGFQCESTAYIIMDFIDGQEMFEVINDLGHYSEQHAKLLFKQLLSGVEFMHRHGVCHRDLKPHNILCVKNSNIIKITDFNVSKFSENYKEYGDLKDLDKIEMWTYTGTVAFSAPEIFTGEGYTQMVDMWSVGCILYSMLSGSLPFNSEYLNDLVENIKQGDFTFPEEQFEFISEEAKDLITKLLKKEPMERLYPDQALIHPWFNPETSIRRKTLKTLTIKDNIHQLTSGSKKFTRQRQIINQVMGQLVSQSSGLGLLRPSLKSTFSVDYQPQEQIQQIQSAVSMDYSLQQNDDALKNDDPFKKSYPKSQFGKIIHRSNSSDLLDDQLSDSEDLNQQKLE